MEVYKELYVSEELKPYQDNIINKIQKREALLNVYVIILSPNERNQLELYNSALNLQAVFSLEQVLVVGIARGYHNALRLVEEMLQTVYEATKDADIRSYILNRQEELKESEV